MTILASEIARRSRRGSRCALAHARVLDGPWPSKTEAVHFVAVIFINYRRADSSAATGRLDDHLRDAFGDEAIYRDIDNIPIGLDFVEHIERAVASCAVFLVIIGERWVNERLNDEHDFVRLEIEA